MLRMYEGYDVLWNFEGEIKNNARAMSQIKLYGGILQRKAEKHEAGWYKFSGISFSTQ